MLDRLQYCKNDPAKGWFDGIYAKTHYEVVGPEVYEVWRCYLPKILKKKIKEVRTWLRRIDDDDIPLEYRRRRTNQEYAELALSVLARLDTMQSAGQSYMLGSQYVCPVAWASIGPPNGLAKNCFVSMNCIREHYDRYLNGEYYAQDIYLLQTGSVPTKIGKKYEMTANLVIALAILLLTDIIMNCGPDCVAVFDVYSNDYRDTPGVETTAWKKKTKKDQYEKPKPSYSIYKPRRSFYNSTVKITEKEVSDDLAAGERTQKTNQIFFFTGDPTTSYSDDPTMADIPEHGTFLRSCSGWFCD